MSDKQYAKRDGAAEEYVLMSRGRTSYEIGLERAAFNAGWEARKRAEYDMILEGHYHHEPSTEPLPAETPDVNQA